MPDIATVWTSLKSPAFISAAVSTGVSLFAKYYFDKRLESDKATFERRVEEEKAQLLNVVNARLETLKASLQHETDRLSAEQTRLTDRMHTVFTTLQTERAQAIKELYAKIVNVESLLNYLSIEKTISADSAGLYRAAVHAFISYYLPNRIWLPSPVSDQVNDLRSLFFSMQKSIATAPRDVPISAEFRQGLIVTKSATARTLEEVSASFRKILGAEMT